MSAAAGGVEAEALPVSGPEDSLWPVQWDTGLPARSLSHLTGESGELQGFASL